MTHTEANPGPGLHRMTVRGIKVWAYHGVFETERRQGQPFVVDLTGWANLTAAAQADDLELTIDYGRLCQAVVDQLEGEPVNLIETLAERLQTHLLAQFDFEFLQVTVHKPQAPLSVSVDDVSVTTARKRRELLARPVVFSLGSNLEPRWDYLQFGLTALGASPGLSDLRCSPVYETTALTPLAQPDFLNVVVVAESRLSGGELLDRGLRIEALAGRQRTTELGPRTLDIDLIQVGELVSQTARLTLPHPRARERGFVLVPWLDLDPAACLGSEMVRDLVPAVSDQTIRRLPGKLFVPAARV